MKRTSMTAAFVLLILSSCLLDSEPLWCQGQQGGAGKETTWLPEEEKPLKDGIYLYTTTIVSAAHEYVVLKDKKKILLPARVKVFDENGNSVSLYQMKTPLRAKITYRLWKGEPTVLSIRPLAD